MANLTTVSLEQMIQLAQKSELLLMARDNLAAIYLSTENQEKLDNAFAKSHPGSAPSYFALQASEQPGPLPEFAVERFFNKPNRARTFQMLFDRIEAIENRTIGVREAYSRNNQTLDRDIFARQVRNWSRQFSDLTDLINNITSYTNAINKLRTFFHQN